jgi:prepilin-type N-terminal cleavage/methylation domain-containing protein
LLVSYQREFKGFSLIEILIAAVIIGTGSAGVLSAFSAYSRAAGAVVPQTQAVFLAEEGVEAVMTLRDSTWSKNLGAMTVGTSYYMTWNTTTGTWATSTTATSTDGMFYRTVTLADVYRDSSDRIVTSGGTLDANSRLATVAVSWWNRTATSTMTLKAYVSNIFNN